VAVAEAQIADAFALSTRINTWEARWFLRGCAERDASKLSRAMRERHRQGEQMTLADYRAALSERAAIRSRYAELASSFDACVTLSAPGAAPAGLQATGNPQFAVPSSLLGVPALSLPVFLIDRMPLGLQIIGFANADAHAFAISAWVMKHITK
jgi:Asp-tRNA(Asn)/Glu-tRNA(Gln) amidotransferase A subunit family amidase